MDARRRFQELYGRPVQTFDYGSMRNFADAHRQYLTKLREYNELRRRLQSQPGDGGQVQWANIFNNNLPQERIADFAYPQEPIPEREPIVPPPTEQQQQPQEPMVDAVQFEAATFMRRLFAEFIDFLFFLALKIFVIGALIEINIIDLQMLGQALDDDQDMMQFINLAQELLPIEIICKAFCCALEGHMMASGMGPIGVGQTPGKWLTGIRVISCRDVTRGDGPNQVVVAGPDLISWRQSIKRSFMKNVVVNSLFPMSTAAFQVNNGRVFYDLVVKTVVVVDL